MIYLIISILAGVSIVIARIINSNLADKIGLLEGTLINFVTGLMLSLVFLLFSSEAVSFSTLDFTQVPSWAYLGGAAGVIVIFLSSYLTPKVSAFYLTLFIFIGQLFTGIVIDYFTLGELSQGKILGGLLVLFGLVFNLRIDRKQEMRSA
ncbi:MULTISPECIES: DMT family transporter [Metabacillus]|uniref:DMT family transporter n=1 Tax=Metabacillus hrfriensis TaxID=3048891 RepID=A0ACD4R5I1_9BACI|nr:MULTISPECIES: DMT family transporter [Metabacillus]UAL50242.1 DMT family transporter [Metabacillus dongyingensis]UOK56353.1 DMT family transporter [Bacillus sp. OVS6]USK26484.1 DMT family transporter [Bacillus sp. CMF21]WHZ55709.1 DMT family transporter [Metabacillus sp. CT-WN-B3]